MMMGSRALSADEENVLKITGVKGPNGATYFDSSVKGEYTFTVAAKKNDNPNIENTATVTFSILDSSVYSGTVGIYYGSQPATTVYVNLTEGESFDASKIKVREADGTPSWSGDQLDVTYIDFASSKAVDASALASAGTYTAVVRVKPYQDENGLWMGGTKTFTIEVTGNKAYGDNVAFFLDGELAGTSGSLEFDGSDLLSRVSATVANPEGGQFEYGTDFTLEAKNSKDEVVESVVDVDDYTITVKPLTIELDGAAADFEFTLHVTPLSVSGLKDFAYDGEKGAYPVKKTYDYDAENYDNDAVAWTGSAVEVPGVQYWDVDSQGYVELDQSLYNVVSIKKGAKVVKDAVEPGTYTVRIALSDAAKSNYSLEEREFTFEVVKYNPFDDVESPAWYASVVADAKFTNVINGMSGTNMFAPGADITRKDAVRILFNLAGGDNAMGDYEFDEQGGFVTGFSDVDGHAYYAKALAWAHNAGVANGFGGEFRPDDKITRQELAAMIANYAKATNNFEATDGSSLAGMSDASTVSGWAADVVDWAIKNGVMGNGGYVAGQDNITRAEVAAMAVNYANKF